MFKPQVLVPPSQFYPTMQLTKPNWTTYGLGWFQHDYRGKMVQFHTGSLDGLVAIFGMIPGERISIYFLQMCESSGLEFYAEDKFYSPLLFINL